MSCQRVLSRVLALGLFAGLTAAAAVSAEAAETNTPTVTVTLNVNDKGPVISRDLFGQFAEHLGRGIYEGIWVGED